MEPLRLPSFQLLGVQDGLPLCLPLLPSSMESMEPCQHQQNWPSLPFPVESAYGDHEEHSDRPVPMEWHSALLHGDRTVPGTGYGTVSCRAELVMANIAKPSQERVKADPGPGEREQVAIDDPWLQGFTHVYFGRAPGAGFHHCRPREASGLWSKMSGAGEATIASARLLWLLISCHWLKVYN